MRLVNIWSAHTVRTRPCRITGKVWYLSIGRRSFRIWSRRYAS